MPFSLSSLLSHWFGNGPESDGLDHCLHQTIEDLNPLLLHNSGELERFRKPLQHAVTYVDQLLEKLPPVMPLTSDQFGSNPLVRALFVSPYELEKSLCCSVAMREHQPAAFSEHQTIYALMGVRWERSLRYGMEQHNGMILNGVPQHVINFKDHTFTLPANSEEELRKLIRRQFIERLTKEVAEKVQRLRQQRDQAHLDIKRLETQIRKEGDSTSLHQQLEQTREQWNSLTSQLGVEKTISHFKEVMEKPEESLWLEPVHLQIDKKSVERPIDQGGEPLELFNLHGADRRVWSSLLVSFPWSPQPSQQEQLEQAHRWLTIS